jgi:hypothetical protein
MLPCVAKHWKIFRKPEMLMFSIPLPAVKRQNSCRTAQIAKSALQGDGRVESSGDARIVSAADNPLS